MKLIANQGTGIIYEFSSTLSIQLMSMPMSFTEKKVNAKMSILNFKIILAELLINRFPIRKCKITVDEPQITVELLQPLKEPDHIVQVTEKRQRCQYCFTNRENDVKCFTYCKSCKVSFFVQKDRNCFKLYHFF